MSTSGIRERVGRHLVITGNAPAILSAHVPDGSIGLAYLDPPFNTARNRSGTCGCGDHSFHFEDGFGSVSEYITWLTPTLEAVLASLRDGGSLFVHCDWRTSHYIKVALDSMLGERNFVNEIIWRRHNGHHDAKQGTTHFGRNGDSILFYGKGCRDVWNPPYLPYDDEYVQRTYKYVEVGTHRRYALSDISGPGGEHNRNPVFEFLGVTKPWRYSRKRLEQLVSRGAIVMTPRARVPRQKRYLDEMQGIPAQSIWDDIPLPRGSERVGYPTQKPIALLQRIIAAASRPDDRVLDPFCGSGTTLVAAERLGRRAVGIDISREATSVTVRRLRAEKNPALLHCSTESSPQGAVSAR